MILRSRNIIGSYIIKATFLIRILQFESNRSRLIKTIRIRQLDQNLQFHSAIQLEHSNQTILIARNPRLSLFKDTKTLQLQQPYPSVLARRLVIKVKCIISIADRLGLLRKTNNHRGCN